MKVRCFDAAPFLIHIRTGYDMKPLSKTAIIGVMALTSFGAIAQEGVELIAMGTAVPMACTPSLSSTHLDWGQVPLDSETVVLPTKSFQVSVSCAINAAVGFGVWDNKEDTLPSGFSADDGWRGLGKASDKSLGAYQIKVRDNKGTVDGGTADAVRQQSSIWLRLTSAVPNDRLISFSTDPSGGLAPTPTPLKALDFTVDVSGRLIHRDELPTDEFSLSGSSTFELWYL